MLSPSHFDEKSKTWSSPKTLPLFNLNVSVGRMLENSFNVLRDRIVQSCYDDDTQMTALELKSLSVRAALNLRDVYKVGRGEVVSFVAKNSKFISAAIFGTVLNLSPFCNLDPTLTVNEMGKMFKVCQPRLVICDDEFEGSIRAALNDIGSKAEIILLLGVKESKLFAAHAAEPFFR